MRMLRRQPVLGYEDRAPRRATEARGQLAMTARRVRHVRAAVQVEQGSVGRGAREAQELSRDAAGGDRLDSHVVRRREQQRQCLGPFAGARAGRRAGRPARPPPPTRPVPRGGRQRSRPSPGLASHEDGTGRRAIAVPGLAGDHRGMKDLVYHRMLLPAADRYADKAATLDADFTATYSEHVERTLRLATGWGRSSGCHRRTALPSWRSTLTNTSSCTTPRFLGAGVINPLNLRLAPKELEFILQDSAPRSASSTGSSPRSSIGCQRRRRSRRSCSSAKPTYRTT